jgi:cysteine desulfurase
VAHLTANFTSEAPLSTAVIEAISAAFEQGWADRKKQSQASGRASILASSALEEIAHHLATTPDRLEVLGEPALSHFIALRGLLPDSGALYSSTVDVGKIRAIAREVSDESCLIGVDDQGLLITTGVKLAKNALLSLQATNGETGVTQELERWRNHGAKVVVDATRTLPDRDYITGFSATTFDARSWNGPAGLGFIAINDVKNFKYPLPHIAPIRTPGSYSLPLLIGSAIALNEFKSSISHLVELRSILANELSVISGVTVLANKSGACSRYLSIVVDGISSEEVLRELLKRDISIDAGSACSPEDLTPSHVIASMGYPTAGHLRFTIHPHHTKEAISEMASHLYQVLNQLRI